MLYNKTLYKAGMGFISTEYHTKRPVWTTIEKINTRMTDKSVIAPSRSARVWNIRFINVVLLYSSQLKPNTDERQFDLSKNVGYIFH